MTDQQTETPKALRLTQRIAAPRATVFEFLVDSELMLRWMGTEAELDARPGGRFWLKVTGTDVASGTYVEVDPPERVVFTWGWEGSVDVPPGSTTVTITLTADGDETDVEIVHSGLPGILRKEHAEGWNRYLPHLATVALDATKEATR